VLRPGVPDHRVPGWVKAWHYHKVQNAHFCVVKGMMKVVFHDAPHEFRVHPHENDIPYKWARKDG
jgi:mannose-6-phosphate isomerase-like protein (cupin superfamily)